VERAARSSASLMALTISVRHKRPGQRVTITVSGR
jgi:hypothetical protein